MNRCKTGPLLPGLLIAAASVAGAETPNLADLDLRALMDMDIHVTSVSKKATRVVDSPAAVTVITQEDLRRLGITRLPEALRMVPGLDVARINGNIWAISARGFNQQYANKLLVLIDGRTVFTPSFGGVLWDAQDLMMEDVDRIEVIRGPGATLWGANAVNGVINITTRTARESQGGLLTSAAGNEAQPIVSARYGGELASNAHYRAYAKYVNGAALVDTTGADGADASHSLRAGFRADWSRTETETLTLQGDGYSGREEENVLAPLLIAPFSESVDTHNSQSGANLLGRWTRALSDTSHTALQTYVDHFRHEGARTVERRDTFDVQWEHRFPAGARHDLMWGLGYRYTTDEFNQTSAVSWSAQGRNLNLYTTFLQDEVALVQNRLSLTLGSKVEHNDYTGLEVQPSVRLRWTPHDRHTLWTSFSQAVSTPARLHREARITLSTFQPAPFQPAVEVVVTGSDDVESERVNAYELGYRFEASAHLSLDLATFYNRYRDVTAPAPGTTSFVLTPIPHVVVEQQWANGIEGHTIGAEASVQWQPLDAWRLTATYSFINMSIAQDFLEMTSPSQQAGLRSYVNLPRRLELNSAVYYVDSTRPPLGLGTTPVGAYVRVDTGVTWRPRDSLELGLWGQNLLDRRHSESTSFNTTQINEVPRTFLARASWHF